MISFWCKNCELDQDLEGYVNKVMGDEYFVADCKKCGKRVVRFISNKRADPYFHQSKRVRIQKEMFARDMIQPGQDGFQLYYKKEWVKIEKAREEYEKKEQMKRINRDNFLQKY